MYSHSDNPQADLEDDETADTVFDTSFSGHPLYQRRSDLFHMLRADHEDLLRFFERMTDADPAEHAARWTRISVPLAAHIRAEREVVYPGFIGSEVTADQARHWLEEHAEIEALLSELDSLPPGDPRLLAKVRQLERKFEHHVDDEEQALLPKVEAAMTESDLDLLTLRFEQRRRQIERELRSDRDPSSRPSRAERRGVRPEHSSAGPGFDDFRRGRETPASTEASREPHIWRPSLSGIASALENRAPATPTHAPTRVAAPRLRTDERGKRVRASGAFLQARILVVDDDENHARRLREILTNASYTRVESTTDPCAVHGLHRRNPYDLILLDLAMPRMSGFEVMANLKRLDPDGALPVVAVASHTSEQVPALRAGARDVIGKPYDTSEILSRVGSVLEARIPEVARRQRYRVIERDLCVAAEIYRALLPSSLPACPGYEVAVVSRSAEDTSGDIYDVIARANGNLVLLLADATGHGIGPALSATQLRSMVRIALRLGASLDGIVAEADRQLAADLPPDRFVTAFVGELDPVAHTIEYFAPGQGPLLHWHAASRRAEWHNASGPPFGVALSAFQRPAAMKLEVGDMVVLATDGVFERANPDGTLFSKEGVEVVLRTTVDASARDIADGLQKRTDHHARGRPSEDDMTLVVLKRTV